MYVSANFSDLGKLISNKNDLKWLKICTKYILS